MKHAMAPQNKHKQKSTLFSVLNIATFSASWSNFFITSLAPTTKGGAAGLGTGLLKLPALA